MNYKQILLTVVIISIMCGVADAAWANTSYTHAKNITLLGADTELTNFPYLVSVAKESAMQADFDDLIFYDQPVYGGGNPIDFEIETYNDTTATVWLNIPTLPTAGKTVSMYYGNAAVSSTADSDATWDSDYVGVWHLSDDVSESDAPSYSSSILSKYSCWGVVDVGQDPNNPQEYIITWQQLPPNGSASHAWINYSVYNISTNSYSTVTPVFDNINYIQQGHATWEYFGGEYHVADCQSNATGDYVRDISNVTWTGLQSHQLTATETTVTPDLGWRTEPSYLKINDSSVWLLCANRYDGGYAYVGYVPWDDVNGFGNWVKISTASDSDCIAQVRGVVKDSVIYLYYITRNPYAFYMIKSTDYGASWSAPVDLGFTNLNSFSTPAVHIRDNKFVMIYGTDQTSPNQILMYRSDDGETFTDMKVIVSETGYPHEWVWLNNTHILLTYPDVDSFVGEEGDLDTGILDVGNYLTFQSTGIDVIDATSNSNDGFPDGGESVSGIIGNAIDFTSDHIAINTPDFYNEGTISWWQNSTSTDAGMVFTGNENVTDSNNYIQTGKDADGKIYFNCGSLGVTLRSDADMVRINEPQHIVITSDGSTTRCFVNGTEVSLTATEGSNTGTWFSDVSNIDKYGIGSLKRVAQEYTPFTGIIDEVKLSKVNRSDDWINLSYQMVVDSSYVSFGAEQTYGADTNDIVLGANKYGMLRKDVSSAQTFSTIAGGFSHDVCFTWWDDVSDTWKSYWVGDSYNSGQSIPKDESYFVLMDSIGETVSCSVASAATVSIPYGWSVTYLRESDAKTLSAIKADMGGNCADLYAWDHTASGTGAWTNTGSYTVLPNQGLLVSASSSFNWDGSVS